MTDKDKLQSIALLLGMNGNILIPKPQRKKTQKDYDLQAERDFNFYISKKILC